MRKVKFKNIKNKEILKDLEAMKDAGCKINENTIIEYERVKGLEKVREYKFYN